MQRLLPLFLQLAAVGAKSSGAASEVLLSRPTKPPSARFYPPQEFLDCDGANFSSVWRGFRAEVAENQRKGFPPDRALYDRASTIVQEFSDGVLAASLKFPQVLVRQIPVTRLNGFCLFGFATALFLVFRHELSTDRLEAIGQTLGWVEWPLDFMESSAWPTLWRHVSLHLEEFQRRGDVSWSQELQHWGDDDALLPHPTVPEVEGALLAWLRAVGTGRGQQWLEGEAPGPMDLARRLGNRKRLRVLVLGHHLGSSMEPFSMLQAALNVGVGLEISAAFYGQRHPKPGLACQEFGYCDENPLLEDWFRRYESRWLGHYDWMPDGWDEALGKLSTVIGSGDFMSKGDLVVCGGPGWFCVMLRILWSVPMLLYFAWPITPLIPPGFKTHIFSYIRSLAQATDPPALIVTANWVLAAQFAQQVRMQVPVQRPHGIYVNQTYAPVAAPGGNQRVMVTRIGQWARVSGVALLELVWSYQEQAKKTNQPHPFELVFLSIKIRGTDTNAALKYADFAKFHACVFWPWDAMMLLFNELYTMTMPLVLPSRRWMQQLISHSLSHTEVNWWHLREAVGGGLPDPSGVPFPLPYQPWIQADDGLRAMSYWYQLTDFMQFPHLTYFDSLPEMMEKLRTLDVPTIRRGMRAYNRVTFRDSLAFYRRAAGELIG